METWRHFGIRSVLGFPLAVGGEPPVGALSFDMMTEERTWPDPLIDRLGLVARVFANALARKRSDERLRESEERLALAADSAGAGLWSLDLATGRFWVTPRTLELLGLPGDETLTFDRFLKTVHPGDRARIRRTAREVMQTGQEGRAEFRVVWPDGSERWIVSRGRASQASSSNPNRLTGVSIDVTERKRLEETTRNLGGRILAAHEAERARLARELHDDVTQRLVCVAMDLARVESSHSVPSVEKPLQRVRSELVRLSEDVHALAYHLHPSILTELGVEAAINTECERFSRQQSIPVATSFVPVPDVLPSDAGLCLFRVVQEALRNVARHAGASRVEVSLEQCDGGLQVAVCDDGQGFNPAEAPKPRSLGVPGMRERLRLLGGTLDVVSAPGRGTTIRAWLPLGAAIP